MEIDITNLSGAFCKLRFYTDMKLYTIHDVDVVIQMFFSCPGKPKKAG